MGAYKEQDIDNLNSQQEEAGERVLKIIKRIYELAEFKERPELSRKKVKGHKTDKHTGKERKEPTRAKQGQIQGE
jgi:hypothetical protein